MSSQWYLSKGAESHGPYSWAEMLQFAREGRIKPTDLVFSESGSEWLRADHVSGLFSTVYTSNNNVKKPAKKNTPMIIGISLFAVLLIIGTVLLVTSITDTNIFDTSPENPEDVVIAFWDAYKKMDLHEATQYVSGDLFGDWDEEDTEFNDNPYAVRLHDLIYGSLDLMVDDHTIDEDKAAVNIQLKTPDLVTLLEEDEDLSRTFFGLYSMAMMSPDDLDEGEIAEIEEFLKAFEAAILRAPKITEENTVILRLEDGQWKITDMSGSGSL